MAGASLSPLPPPAVAAPFLGAGCLLLFLRIYSSAQCLRLKRFAASGLLKEKNISHAMPDLMVGHLIFVECEIRHLDAIEKMFVLTPVYSGKL
jgi:hypothetical protein